MFNIANRNIKVFLRNRSAVFFSFLGVIIVIGLYVLFLGDTMKSNFGEMEGVDVLMDNWVMAGLISVASITTTMGAFGTMITDKENKSLKDFYCAPLKRRSIAGGYILSSFFIGIVMSVLTFILGELYIVINGGELLSVMAIIKVLGVIVLCVLASSAMIFFLVSMFSSNGAFSTASTVVGTLIGFLTGIYIPIGVLPEAVQVIIKVFPVSHAAALLRQIMVEEPIKETFTGTPASMVTEFKEQFGVIFQYGDYTAGTVTHLLILVITAVVFYGLAILNISRKKS
ncbi:MAG: ABC transporter permease [Bacillaceae bacterium]